MKKNIPYIIEETPPHKKHLLDIYGEVEPDSKRPVLVYFHGGGWESGDKELFRHLGETLAAHNILGAIVNYRLSPEVVHPAHAYDCAAALAWVYQSISWFGGDPEDIFLCGHSAGAHLASLISLDPRYLSSYDLSPAIIAGVIALSGVYRFNSESKDIPGKEIRLCLKNPVFQAMITKAFGNKPEILDEASPVHHNPQVPVPFLVLYGARENRYIKCQSELFFEYMKKNNLPGSISEIPDTDHITIVTDIWKPDSRVFPFILNYIKENSRSSV